MSKFLHAHTHSEFSTLDGISSVASMVAKAKRLKQPGIALTDHGNMSGSVQLYKAGKEHGLQVFPGFEGYLTVDPITDSKEASKLERYHIGMLALNLDGFRTLSELSSLTHTRPRFSRFPRMDLNDLAALAGNEDIAVLTGCFFGLLQQTLVRQGYDAAKRVARMYAKWFPNLFVEIQNHNIEHTEQDENLSEEFSHDADIAEALYSIAQELGLLVICTQDSHYLDSKDVEAHRLMKRMVYGGEGTENEFPGDSFHLASTEWVEEHHEPAHWKAGLEGCEELLGMHDLSIPPLDKYKADIPSIRKNPQTWLERKCLAALERMYDEGLLVKPLKLYQKRLEHEFDTIKFLGQAGYFGIVYEVVQYCNNEGIFVEARGSANGSLVCYTLGITQADPLQWGLLFERFLSKDRKKPPDIDLDVEDDKRSKLVAWLHGRFGVVQIGTFGTLGSRDDGKGSLLVTYNAHLRKKFGQEFRDRFGPGIEYIEDVKRYNKQDYVGLRLLGNSAVKRSAGVHAAGLLLPGDYQRVEDYIPTMLIASSGTVVTQFTMDDVEELGYLKLDILGGRTLTVMRRCQELIGRDDPEDFSWIPLDDKAACKKLTSKWESNRGIFQFEGYATTKGAEFMGIKNTNDCILAGALFRPACIESGVMHEFVNRRKNPSERQNIKHPHPAFAEVLKPTHGLVIYQEQVLEILRRLGMSYEDINTFFKIVKDSGKGATARNIERAREVKKRWAEICERNGITDPEAAWHYIEGYTQYGFNKAHATGYGIRAYRTAYLKTHYPLEYMAALLESWAGRKPKEDDYIKEARRLEIRLLPPDVNISGPLWTLDRNKNAIRKGLSSIKGVGMAAAQDIASKAPFDSFEDMLERCNARSVSGKPRYEKEGVWTGMIKTLRDAGALASLGIYRDE